LLLWLNARNISSLGTGTLLSHAQASQIADSETTFSPAYYFTVVKLCERLYYFSWFMAGLFTHQSVYSYISNCSWKNKLSRVW